MMSKKEQLFYKKRELWRRYFALSDMMNKMALPYVDLTQDPWVTVSELLRKELHDVHEELLDLEER